MSDVRSLVESGLSALRDGRDDEALRTFGAALTSAPDDTRISSRVSTKLRSPAERYAAYLAPLRDALEQSEVDIETGAWRGSG